MGLVDRRLCCYNGGIGLFDGGRFDGNLQSGRREQVFAAAQRRDPGFGHFETDGLVFFAEFDGEWQADIAQAHDSYDEQDESPICMRPASRIRGLSHEDAIISYGTASIAALCWTRCGYSGCS